jgi:hypothetical protein
MAVVFWNHPAYSEQKTTKSSDTLHRKWLFFDYRMLKLIFKAVKLTILPAVFLYFIIRRLMERKCMQAEITWREFGVLTTSFAEWDYGMCDKDRITAIIFMCSFCNSSCAWGCGMPTSHANLQFEMFKHKTSAVSTSSFTSTKQYGSFQAVVNCSL